MAADINKKINLDISVKGQKELDAAIKRIDTLLNPKKKDADPVKDLLRAELRELQSISRELEYQNSLRKKAQDLIDQESEKLRQQQSRQNNPQTLGDLLRNRINPVNRLKDQLSETQSKQSAAFSRFKTFTAKGAEQRDIHEQLTERVLGRKRSPEEQAAFTQSLKLAQQYEKQAGKAKAEAAVLGEQGDAISGKLSAASTGVAVSKTAAKFAKKAADEFSRGFKAVTGISLSIKDNFSDILTRVKAITDSTSGMASYATESSLFTNAAARTTRLTYGLSGSQAYGFEQAKSMLGIKSEEDLMYMNRSQRAVFIQLMERQQSFYDKLESSGTLRNIQEMQLDLEMFKQEMAVGFLEWMSENKDVILSVAKGILTVLKALITVLGKVFSFFGMDVSDMSYGAGSSKISDAAAVGSSTSYKNNYVNMNMTNNANGVYSSPESMYEAMGEYMQQAVRQAVTEI